eukprot:3387-Heterococcus_DN1.PRE.1
MVLFCDWLEAQPEYCLQQPSAVDEGCMPPVIAATDVVALASGDIPEPDVPAAAPVLATTASTTSITTSDKEGEGSSGDNNDGSNDVAVTENGVTEGDTPAVAAVAADDSNSSSAAQRPTILGTARAQERARRGEFWEVVCHLANALPDAAAAAAAAHAAAAAGTGGSSTTTAAATTGSTGTSGASSTGTAAATCGPGRVEKPLREHDELRGYLPLHDLYQQRYPPDPVQPSTVPVPDEALTALDDRAGSVRIAAVKAFCEYMTAQGDSGEHPEYQNLIMRDATTGRYFTGGAAAASNGVAVRPQVLKQVPYKDPDSTATTAATAAAAAASAKAAGEYDETGVNAAGTGARKLGQGQRKHNAKRRQRAEEAM